MGLPRVTLSWLPKSTSCEGLVVCVSGEIIREYLEVTHRTRIENHREDPLRLLDAFFSDPLEQTISASCFGNNRPARETTRTQKAV
jgi:hypothetical protein